METAKEDIMAKVKATKFRNIPMRPASTYSLRYQAFKIKAKHTWLQAKTGFKYGAVAGGVAGFVLGLPAFVKHRQVSILIVSTLFSAGFFASIASIGTLVHQQ